MSTVPASELRPGDVLAFVRTVHTVEATVDGGVLITSYDNCSGKLSRVARAAHSLVKVTNR